MDYPTPILTQQPDELHVFLKDYSLGTTPYILDRPNSVVDVCPTCQRRWLTPRHRFGQNDECDVCHGDVRNPGCGNGLLKTKYKHLYEDEVEGYQANAIKALEG